MAKPHQWRQILLDRRKKYFILPLACLFALVFIWSILFWAVTIPWLSMTFPSFPWPMFSSFSQSIVKTICYLKYFSRLTTGLSVIISTFDLFAFLFSSLQFHDFPCLENEIRNFNDFPGFPWPENLQPLNKFTLPEFFPVTVFYWKLCFIWQMHTALNYLPTMKYYYLVFHI